MFPFGFWSPARADRPGFVFHYPVRFTCELFTSHNFRSYLASPTVKVKYELIEGQGITLEELGSWIGREIDVIVTVVTQRNNERLQVEGWSIGKPHLTDAQSVAETAQKFDPLAVFSGLPKLTVSELQKVEFFKPGDDGSAPPAMGISTARPVVIIGRLRDIFQGTNQTTFTMTAAGDKPAIEFTISSKAEELGELHELVGKEIAVVPDQVYSFSARAIEITPATLLYEGRSKTAVFAGEKLDALSQTPSSSGKAATEGRVSIAKAPTNSDAPEVASPNVPVATRTPTAPTIGSARTEKLREPAAFPVVVNGRKAGETKIAPGTVVTVLEEKGDHVLLKSGLLEPHWFPVSKITDPPPPPPTTFSSPVDGEMTRFTRWGSGDKLIVFFNNNGFDNGPDGPFDTMPKEIERALHAYAPLLREGYSLVVWNYPFNMRFSRATAVRWELQQEDKKRDFDKPDFSGIAASVVEGIRKETGASEMLLVGNSMGAGVLLEVVPLAEPGAGGFYMW